MPATVQAAISISKSRANYSRFVRFVHYVDSCEPMTTRFNYSSSRNSNSNGRFRSHAFCRLDVRSNERVSVQQFGSYPRPEKEEKEKRVYKGQLLLLRPGSARRFWVDPADRWFWNETSATTLLPVHLHAFSFSLFRLGLLQRLAPRSLFVDRFTPSFVAMAVNATVVIVLAVQYDDLSTNHRRSRQSQPPSVGIDNIVLTSKTTANARNTSSSRL